MTAPNGLGTFVRPQMQQGDKFTAQDNKNKPLLVWVRDYKTGMKTKHHPNGDGEGVIVDLVDLTTNQGYCGVLWMGGAVRDGLGQYVGTNQPLPIMLAEVPGSNGGNSYIAPQALEGPVLQYATDWFNAYPTYIVDLKVQKEAEWAAAQAAAGVPQAPQAPGGVAIQGLAGPAPQAPQAQVPQAPAPAVPQAPAPAAPQFQQPQPPAVPQPQFQAPQAPQVPQMPQAPVAPQVPQVPAMAPQAPVAPQVPQMPQAPAPAAPQAPVAPQMPAMPQMPQMGVPGQVTDQSVAALQAKLDQM